MRARMIRNPNPSVGLDSARSCSICSETNPKRVDHPAPASTHRPAQLLRIAVACCIALVCFAAPRFSTPAHAQIFERWVSSQIGNDDNNCTRTVESPDEDDEDNDLEEDVYDTRACATIARALAVAGPGDIIYVAGGSYNLPLVIDKNITIIGGFPLFFYDSDGRFDFERVPSPQSNPNQVSTSIQTGGVPAITIRTQSFNFAPDAEPMKVRLDGLRVGATSVGGNGAAIRIVPGGSTFPIPALAWPGEIKLQQMRLQNSSASGNGGGLYISGSGISGQGRTTVEFENGTITNNSAGNGGGLYITGPADLKLLDATIQNNSTSGSGGGIYVTGGAELSYNGGVVHNNQAPGGTGGGFFGTGAAVTASLNGLTLTNNSALQGGALGFNNLSPSVENLHIQENLAGNHGGGIYAEGATFTLVGSTLLTNTATSGNGGGIFLNVRSGVVVTVTGTSVAGNRALGASDGHGGGIFVTRTSGTLGRAVIGGGLELVHNEARRGGGLYAQTARVESSGTDFNLNTATLQGGGLFLGSLAQNSVFQGATFAANTAPSGGGLYATGNFALNSPTFSGNSAEMGGGFYLSGSVVTAGGNIFLNQNAASQAGGGGYLTAGAFLNAASIDAIQNQATHPNPATAANTRGGALAIDNGARLAVSGSILAQQNQAGGNGGALHILDSPGVTQLLNGDSALLSNTAGGQGGAFFIQNAPIQINTATFQGNETLVGSGGALVVNNTTLTANGAIVFNDNEAANHGGAVSANQATLSFQTTPNFSSNLALSGRGGALALVAPAGSPTAAGFSSGAVFANNQATWGGAIYAEGVTLNFNPGTRFQENSAPNQPQGRGGALYISGASLTLDDVFFDRNSAFLDGGAIHLENGNLTTGPQTRFEGNFSQTRHGGALYYTRTGGQVTINGSRFEQNRAAAGGALYLTTGNLTLNADSLLRANRAVVGNGGAVVALDTSATINITQARVEQNQAENDGAGFYLQVGTLNIDGATFAHNAGKGAGGGLFAQVAGATIQNSTLEANFSEQGAGLYLAGRNGQPGQAQWINNTVRNNHAGTTGGGLYLLGMTLASHNSDFFQNRAQDNGGGVYALYSRTGFTNTVIAQNRITATLGHGGGIWATNSHVALNHSTLAGHTHTAELSSAAAVHLDSPLQGSGPGGFSSPTGGTLTIRNAIIAENQIGLLLLPGNRADLSTTLWQNTRFDWTGEGDFVNVVANRRGDPRFFNPALGDYRIRRESAAFDLAIDTGLATDKAGTSRGQGFAPDAGAFEHRYIQGLYLDAQVSSAFARTGDLLEYTIRVRNTSAQPVADVILEATLPNSQPQPAASPGACQGPFCTANLGTIAAGAEVVVTIAVQVQGQAPASGLGTMNANLLLRGGFAQPDSFGDSDKNLTARAFLFACRVQLNGQEYPSVQAAIDAAPNDGSAVIRVHGHCGDLHTSGGPGQAVTLNKNVTLQGGWNSDFTQRDPAQTPSAIDAGGLGRAVYVAPGFSPVLEDINLRGGATRGLGGGLWGKDAGGGLYLVDSGATLRGVDIAGSRSDDLGGGVYIHTDLPVVFENSAIRQNEAGERGGGLFITGSDPLLNRVNIAGNRARAGGGLYLRQSGAILQAVGSGNTPDPGPPNAPTCRIDSNQATGSALWRGDLPTSLQEPTFWLAPGGGGGIFAEDSAAEIVRCSIRTNQARSGAGVYLHRQPLTLQQSILTGNTTTIPPVLSTDGAGGGLYLMTVASQQNLLDSNYFGFNRATRGSALYAHPLDGNPLTLRHPTFAHNLGDTGVYLAGAGTLNLADSIVAFNTGTAIFAGGNPGNGPAINLNRTLWHENPTNTGQAGAGAVNTENDFSGDPAFFDDGFRIKRISAAYGRGGSEGLLADRDGDLRPQGAARDLGADEYAPAQAVRYVATNGNDANTPCLDYLNPCRTLQAALDAADAGDLIKMAGGTYTGVQTRNSQTQYAYIEKNVTIQGGYYPRTDNNDVTDSVHSIHDWELPHPDENPTILDAASQGRVLTIVSPEGQTIAPKLAYLTLERGLTGNVGGGVLVQNAEPIFDSVLVRANTAAHGGGVYLRNSGGQWNQMTLTGNTATASGGQAGQGGGIYIEGGAPTLQALTIEANQAITGAGVYIAAGTATLIQNNVVNNGNEATQAGGGIYLAAHAGEVLTNTVGSNQAQRGGGLYLHSSQAHLQGNNIVENQATGANGQGGGLYIVDGAPVVRHNSISSNRAPLQQDGQGGGLFLRETQADIQHNEIFENRAARGAGIFLYSVDSATLAHNLVRNNRADEGTPGIGGGLYYLGGTVPVTENIVRNNRAKQGAGIAFFCNPDVCTTTEERRPTLDQNQIVENRATEHGGGLFVSGGLLRVVDNQIARNSTDQGNGAGVYLTQSDTVLQENSIKENVAALNGGGLYLLQDRTILRSGQVLGNRANSGGGLYLQNLPDAGGVTVAPRIEGIAISGNVAAANGGGIYARQSRARLKQLHIFENRAVNDGGGVYIDESILGRFEGNLIERNEAGSRGGGIFFIRQSNTVAASNAVIDNVADSDGGGVAILGSSPTLAHTTLARNVPNAVMANTANNQGGQARFFNTIIAQHDLGVRTFAGIQVHLSATLFHANQSDTSGPNNTLFSNGAQSGDPAFADDGYRLTGGSAAVGAGTLLDTALSAQIEGDIDGEARVQGTGPDLGADELTAPCYVVRAANTGVVYDNIQQAVDIAGPGAEIRISGTCSGLFTRGGLRQVVLIDKNLTLRGGYAPGAWNSAPDPVRYPTVIDARNPATTGRAIYIAPGTLVVLENLTLINGNAQGLGGGSDTGTGPVDAGGNLLIDGVDSVTLRRISLRQGVAQTGGGVYVRATSGTIVDGEMVANTAELRGGGFYLAGGTADLAVRNNLIQGNEARTGGGGVVIDQQPTVANNRFVANRAVDFGGRGGGLFAQNTTSSLINNQYRENRAAFGGALYAEGGLPLVFNNMAGRNIAQQGSAFYLHNTPVNLRHNTVVDNRGPGTGANPAAIYFESSAGLVEFDFANNIVVGHAIGLSAGPNTTGLARANLWHENTTRWSGDIAEGQGNRNEPPRLRDRAAGDYFLAPDSPAIDQGVNAGVSIDIQNRPRPGRLGYDIGADEFLVPAVTATLSALPNPVGAGEQVGFVAEIANTGDTDLTAEVTLNLPAGFVSQDTLQFSGIQLPRGTNWSRTLAARVGGELLGTFNAELVVTTNQGVGAGATTQVVAAEITSELIDISLTTDPSPVPAGAEAAFRLQVANAGGTSLDTEIQVTLPPAITPGSETRWNPTIAGPDGSWTTVFTGTVASDAPDILPVDVQVISVQGPARQLTIELPLAKPALAAAITSEPEAAQSGSRLVYRFTLSNTGNVPLNLEVSPEFGPQFVPLSPELAAPYALNLAPGNSNSYPITGTVETGFEGTLESSLRAVAVQGIETTAQSAVAATRPTFSPTRTARGGNWHSPETWEPPIVPGPQDFVYIPSGVRVVADRPIDIRGLRNEGELILRGESDAGVQTQQLRIGEILENFGLIQGEDGRVRGSPGTSISIEMDGLPGSVYNEGIIRGGHGGPDGGFGGAVRMAAGSLTNNGEIVGGNGADVTNPAADLDGGRGGSIFIALEPGQLVNRGNIDGGTGGAAHPAAQPPRNGGTGGDVTVLGTSLVRLDNSQVAAGRGGLGTTSARDGAYGTIGIAAVIVSRVNTTFEPDPDAMPDKVQIVQSGDTTFNFSVLGPNLIIGRIGGSDAVATLRIFNRSARQETYLITPLSAPTGWQPLGLPATVTIPPFKSQAVGVRIRPPQPNSATTGESSAATASAAGGLYSPENSALHELEIARLLGLPLELRVTAQRNAALRIDVPIGIVDGFRFSGALIYLPRVERAPVTAVAGDSAPALPGQDEAPADLPDTEASDTGASDTDAGETDAAEFAGEDAIQLFVPDVDVVTDVPDADLPGTDVPDAPASAPNTDDELPNEE